MIERIIEIAETAAYLHLENSLMIVSARNTQDVSVPVQDVGCLILSNPAVSITGALLAAISANGGVIVISDEKHLPVSMQLPLSANCVQTERFHAQLKASLPLRKQMWKTIVQNKLASQACLLKELMDDDMGLGRLCDSVRSGDSDNVEAQAARIYWKGLFGKSFVRDRETNGVNQLLNYGYTIVRALMARACCAAGLHPTLGISHHNKYDAYCLADDLMEPFRAIVDREVYAIDQSGMELTLCKDVRHKLLELPYRKVPTRRGMLAMGDLAGIVASRVAQSFITGENSISYE